MRRVRGDLGGLGAGYSREEASPCGDASIIHPVPADGESSRLRMRHPDMLLASFIEPFLTSLESPKSRSDYSRYLREFDAFTGETTLRAALTLQNGTLFRERVK